MTLNIYDKVYDMDTVRGIWQLNDRIRITYVKQGWLVVWDHTQSPPLRYDCEGDTHNEACDIVVKTVQKLMATSK